MATKKVSAEEGTKIWEGFFDDLYLKAMNDETNKEIPAYNSALAFAKSLGLRIFRENGQHKIDTSRYHQDQLEHMFKNGTVVLEMAANSGRSEA